MGEINETRVRIASTTLALSLLFAPLDGMVKWHNGDLASAIITLLFAVCSALILWLARTPRFREMPVYALLLLLVLAFVLGFPRLAQHPEMAIWLPLYPFYFYSLAGRRIGTLLVVASLGYLYLIFLWNDYSQAVNIPAAAVAYILSILLGYTHERAHTATHTKLERMALLDNLTGAYNRHGLACLWGNVQRHAQLTGTPLTLLLFDIDHFKGINDRYGHDTGDAILRSVAQLVSKRIRASDYLVRWGGEEFLIILPGANPAQAGRVAEELRSTLAQHRFEQVGQVTCSFGISHVDESTDLDSSLKLADSALYQAKERGRNCVVIAENSAPLVTSSA